MGSWVAYAFDDAADVAGHDDPLADGPEHGARLGVHDTVRLNVGLNSCGLKDAKSCVRVIVHLVPPKTTFLTLHTSSCLIELIAGNFFVTPITNTSFARF